MFWLLLAIAAWGLLHSWMASLGVREGVERQFGGEAARFYRLFYNFVSVVTFGAVLLLVRLLPDRRLYAAGSPWLQLLLALQALALVGLLAAILQTDALALLGLRQLAGREQSAALLTDGLYRYVRHPMYTFGLLFMWLTPYMTFNTLTAYVGLTVYLLVGAYFEERKLARVFGARYTEYKRRTPMFLPFPGRS